MTTASTAHGLAAPWRSGLVRALRDAQALVSPVATEPAAAPDLDRLETAIEHLGDVLHDASAEIGLEDPLAWRLLEIRDRLSSHAHAARALGQPDGAIAARSRLLRRGVESVAVELTAFTARAAEPQELGVGPRT